MITYNSIRFSSIFRCALALSALIIPQVGPSPVAGNRGRGEPQSGKPGAGLFAE